jgi:hypothetical protein
MRPAGRSRCKPRSQESVLASCGALGRLSAQRRARCTSTPVEQAILRRVTSSRPHATPGARDGRPAESLRLSSERAERRLSADEPTQASERALEPERAKLHRSAARDTNRRATSMPLRSTRITRASSRRFLMALQLMHALGLCRRGKGRTSASCAV